jgi:hypothetical protein
MADHAPKPLEFVDVAQRQALPLRRISPRSERVDLHLLPHLSSKEAVHSTSFRAWGTLLRILNRGGGAVGEGGAEPQIQKIILGPLGLGLRSLELSPSALPWGSVMVSGGVTIRFKKWFMDADGVLPVV